MRYRTTKDIVIPAGSEIDKVTAGEMLVASGRGSTAVLMFDIEDALEAGTIEEVHSDAS